MQEIRDVRLGQVTAFPPLPPFPTPQDILRDALPLLDPPSLVSVTDAAERYTRIQTQGIWTNFDRTVTPYLVEPADMTQSRRFRGVVFLGPSQSGKTKMLESVSYHAVTCNQQPVLIVHMTKGDRDKWVEEKVDPTIANSPELRERLGSARDDSTFSRKRFRGMRLTIGYPTATILSGGTYGMVLLTDYDHMPLVLGGRDNPEGSPFRMALNRVRVYLSRGCVLAEGSPAWPSTDPDWAVSPLAPHEFPPVEGGIAKLYNEGTRARLYWQCPDCGEEFEPRFDRLHYDRDLDPGAAGLTAEMECPHCHVLIAHRHKMELNRAILKDRGGWRHEAQEPGKVVSIEAADVRRAGAVSYALNGAAATFANWPDMVAAYEEARRRAEELGDDSDLATVHYTDIGVPHVRPRNDAEDGVSLAFLKDHLQQVPRGVAPSWTRCIVITIDVQNSWFPVQVTAFGDGAQAQIIDRIEVTAPPGDAPNAVADQDGNRRRIDPPRYLEDWSALEALEDRVFRVDGAEYGLQAAALVVDFQGAPGVSDNAEAFFLARKAAGQGRRWFLSRGQGGWRIPFRVKHEAPDRSHGGGKARRVKLLTMAVDRIKDSVHAGLSRADGGQGAIYLPEWMRPDDAMLGEYIAEERNKKGWEKKKGQIRNEGFDLTVQARAVVEHKKLLRVDVSAPPKWAAQGPENTHAVMNEGGDSAAVAAEQEPARQINFLRRG